jgi:tRNA1(Val) A37 N6-methylase TrmN6
VLLEAAAGKVGRSTAPIEPPLFVHEPDGGFTVEVKQMLGEPTSSADFR